MTWCSWVSNGLWTFFWWWGNELLDRSRCCKSLSRSLAVVIYFRNNTSPSFRLTSTLSRGCRWDSGTCSLGILNSVGGESRVLSSIKVGRLFLLALVFTNNCSWACSTNACWERRFATSILLIPVQINFTKHQQSNVPNTDRQFIFVVTKKSNGSVLKPCESLSATDLLPCNSFASGFLDGTTLRLIWYFLRFYV